METTPMSEDKVYKVLAEYITQEEKTFGTIDKIEVHYKQPNSSDPGRVWKHQAVVDDLSETALKILATISTGERCCIHNGKIDGYPAILNITDASDAPAKATGGNAKYNNNKGGNYKPKDDTGVALGAAWNNAEKAVEIVGVTYESVEEYIKDVARVAWLIFEVKEAKGKEVKAAKKAAEPSEAKEEKPKSKLQLAKEAAAAEAAAKTKAKTKKEAPPEPEEVDDLEDDDLGDVDFGDEV